MGNSCQGTSPSPEFEFHVPQTGFRVTIRSVKKMGWKPDLPDHRDRVVDIAAPKKNSLPKKIDLRPEEHFEVYDQGGLGSCTANAIGACFHFDQVKQGLTEFTPSRLFIYYNERAMEGTVGEDSGAYIRDGIKSLKDIGCCSETEWAYDESKFTLRPADKCYEGAAKNRAKEYARVPQNLDAMKSVLDQGFPFAFGFVVCTSFMKVDSSGMMSFPTDDDQILGGHAVCACGYDDEKQVVIVRNSWGNEWGDGGYFYMPYGYITHPQLTSDLWYIQSVDGKSLPTKKMFQQQSR